MLTFKVKILIEISAFSLEINEAVPFNLLA